MTFDNIREIRNPFIDLELAVIQKKYEADEEVPQESQISRAIRKETKEKKPKSNDEFNTEYFLSTSKKLKKPRLSEVKTEVAQVRKLPIVDEYSSKFIPRKAQDQNVGQDHKLTDIYTESAGKSESFEDIYLGKRNPSQKVMSPEKTARHLFSSRLIDSIFSPEPKNVTDYILGSYNESKRNFFSTFSKIYGIPETAKNRKRFFYKERKLIKLIKELCPSKEFSLRKITEDTSAAIVGSCNGRIFKVYTDAKQAREEARVLRELGKDTELRTFITKISQLVKPYSPTESLEKSITAAGLTGEETRGVLSTIDTGVLSFENWHVLITESEELTLEPGSYTFARSKRDSCAYERFLNQDSFDKRDKTLEELAEGLSKNRQAKRLYTLSRLHKSKVDVPVIYEDKGIKNGEDHFNSYRRVREFFTIDEECILPKQLLQQYVEASVRQFERFQKRQDSLCFTHGDAKWDNWMGLYERLGDFGSAKRSTEYKDIAKSLLDSKDVLNEEIIDEYIDLYITLRRESGNESKEEGSEFKSHVYDALITESVRTVFYKYNIPGFKAVTDHCMNVAKHYANIQKSKQRLVIENGF